MRKIPIVTMYCRVLVIANERIKFHFAQFKKIIEIRNKLRYTLIDHQCQDGGLHILGDVIQTCLPHRYNFYNDRLVYILQTLFIKKRNQISLVGLIE